MVKGLKGLVSWLLCHAFHHWTRYHAIRYGCGEHDVEAEEVCYCTTCGRDRPSWLRG